ATSCDPDKEPRGIRLTSPGSFIREKSSERRQGARVATVGAFPTMGFLPRFTNPQLIHKPNQPWLPLAYLFPDALWSSARMAWAMAPFEPPCFESNTAEPATRTSAPASTTSGAV